MTQKYFYKVSQIPSTISDGRRAFERILNKLNIELPDKTIPINYEPEYLPIDRGYVLAFEATSSGVHKQHKDEVPFTSMVVVVTGNGVNYQTKHLAKLEFEAIADRCYPDTLVVLIHNSFTGYRCLSYVIEEVSD